MVDDRIEAIRRYAGSGQHRPPRFAWAKKSATDPGQALADFPAVSEPDVAGLHRH
jgi:hypothetical protein